MEKPTQNDILLPLVETFLAAEGAAKNQAFEKIIKLLESLIYEVCHKQKIPGNTADDNYQVCVMFLFTNGIYDYKQIAVDGKQHRFDSFIFLICKRYLLTELKKTYQDKRRTLDHNSQSFDAPIADDNDISSLDFASETATPDEQLIKKETIDNLLSVLTPMEKDIYQVYIQRYTYEEAAELLKPKYPEINARSIDNALTRIKKVISGMDVREQIKTNFTPRQEKIMDMRGQGIPRTEIAAKLGIKLNRLYDDIKIIKRKLPMEKPHLSIMDCEIIDLVNKGTKYRQIAAILSEKYQKPIFKWNIRTAINRIKGMTDAPVQNMKDRTPIRYATIKKFIAEMPTDTIKLCDLAREHFPAEKFNLVWNIIKRLTVEGFISKEKIKTGKGIKGSYTLITRISPASMTSEAMSQVETCCPTADMVLPSA